MGSKTGIEWTDATWNPILGCSRVSEGCRNCYAEGIAARFRTNKSGKDTVYSGLTQIVNGHPQWTGKIVETKKLLEPLSWKKPKRIFVNSMSDLFHENVTDEQIDKIFTVMALCPQHTFQVLTKRPKRMLAYLDRALGRVADLVIAMRRERGDYSPVCPLPHLSPCSVWWPLANVWLGVSVENQATADERIPLLLQTSAAVRFISAEPLLGKIDLTAWSRSVRGVRPDDFKDCARATPSISWIICGGESGRGARPMNPEWARSLRDQCEAARAYLSFLSSGASGHLA